MPASSRDSLRCGLVGFGRVAELYYAPALARCRAARFVAVADPRPERRAEISRSQPDCAVHESVDDLIRDSSVDALIVTTPPETHAAIVRSAVDASLPVLVEKPMAATTGEALALAERVAAVGAHVQVGFNRRFWRPVERLREILTNSTASGPSSIELSMSTDVAAWNAVSGSPGALIDLGCHQLDLLRFLFGTEIESISASRVGPNVVTMRVRLVDGALTDETVAHCRLAYGESSHEWISVRLGPQRYRIHGPSDLVRPAGGAARWLLDASAAVVRRARRRAPSLLGSFDRQLSWFVDGVLSGRDATPDVRDGLRTVFAVDAAQASTERGGEEVSLPA